MSSLSKIKTSWCSRCLTEIRLLTDFIIATVLDMSTNSTPSASSYLLPNCNTKSHSNSRHSGNWRICSSSLRLDSKMEKFHLTTSFIAVLCPILPFVSYTSVFLYLLHLTIYFYSAPQIGLLPPAEIIQDPVRSALLIIETESCVRL